MKSYKEDVTKMKVSPDMGTDVKNTSMLSGKGSMTSAQNESNSTIPYSTGKASKPSNCGGEASH